MHWLYIFALCLLVWVMITKNIYSRNVCMLVFMRIVSMHIVNMWQFFMHIVSMWWFLWELLLLKLIFNTKRYYVCVWGVGKNVLVLWVFFLMWF